MSKAYVVTHSMLGSAGHVAGEVVEFPDDLIKKLGIDVEHLMHLGAIRPATSDEAKSAVTYGDSAEAAAQPFPAVPYAPTTPEGAAAAVPADTSSTKSK